MGGLHIEHYDGTNYYYRCSKVNNDLTTNTTMAQTTTTDVVLKKANLNNPGVVESFLLIHMLREVDMHTN